METCAPNVSALITDFWQRYPARHDLRVAVDRTVMAIYANSEGLLDRIKLCFEQDLVVARPDALLAVIQDPSISPVALFPDGRSSFSLTVSDGRVNWIADKGLLMLYNGGRYMIGGNCEAHLPEIRRFVESAATDYRQSSERGTGLTTLTRLTGRTLGNG